VLRTDVHVARDEVPQLQQELDALVPQLEADPERHADELLRAYQNRVHLHIFRDDAPSALHAGQVAFEFALQRFGARDARTVLASNLRAEAAQYDESNPEASVAVAHQGLLFATAAFADNAAHPRLAEAREIYARSLSQAHHEQTAITEWYQALREARAELGPGSFLEGTIAANMVPSLRRSGRIKEALQMADLGLENINRHVQHRSATFVAHATTHGTIELAARRGDRAMADLAEAVAVSTQVMGPTDGVTLTAQCNLALAQAYEGQLEQSRLLLDQVVPGYARTMPQYNDYVHYVTGVRWRLAGDPLAAIAAQRRALAASPAGDFGNFSRMRVLTELALAQAEAHQAGAALATLGDLTPLLAKQLSMTAPYHAEAWLAGGRALLEQGRTTEAVESLRKAYAFWQDFDATHRQTGEAAYWLARALVAQGDTAAAAQLQRTARDILRQSRLPRDRQLL
jgi:tetratricopeptide (TPR) repeat protein